MTDDLGKTYMTEFSYTCDFVSLNTMGPAIKICLGSIFFRFLFGLTCIVLIMESLNFLTIVNNFHFFICLPDGCFMPHDVSLILERVALWSEETGLPLG